jgi:hypothetical protein
VVPASPRGELPRRACRACAMPPLECPETRRRPRPGTAPRFASPGRIVSPETGMMRPVICQSIPVQLRPLLSTRPRWRCYRAAPIGTTFDGSTMPSVERGAHRVGDIVRRQMAVMLFDHARIGMAELRGDNRGTPIIASRLASVWRNPWKFMCPGNVSDVDGRSWTLWKRML